MKKLTILGSSDAFHSGGRSQTCFLLEAGSRKLLIDCGAGALKQLKAKGFSSEDIDLMILSHFHGDHSGGLPFFFLDAARLKREKPLYIFSPEGGKEFASEALKLFYPGIESIVETLPIHWLYYEKDTVLAVEGAEVQGFPVIHTPAVKPHAVRISVAGSVIAYSGDTGWTDSLIEASRNADLFICECTFFQKEEKNHLNYITLRKYRDQLHCRRLLLTHFDEEMLSFASEIQEEMAFDGMELFL